MAKEFSDKTSLFMGFAFSNRSVRVGLGIAVLSVSIFGTSPGVASAQDNVEAALQASQQAATGSNEQQTEASRILDRCQQQSRRVQRMLDRSRNEADVIKAACLNSTLNQQNATVRTLQDRVQSLTEAVESADEGRRNHEYTVISVLGRRCEVLDQEANQCLGNDIFETGETNVTSSVDPSTPDVEIGESPMLPTITVPFVPAPASPTG